MTSVRKISLIWVDDYYEFEVDENDNVLSVLEFPDCRSTYAFQKEYQHLPLQLKNEFHERLRKLHNQHAAGNGRNSTRVSAIGDKP